MVQKNNILYQKSRRESFKRDCEIIFDLRTLIIISVIFVVVVVLVSLLWHLTTATNNRTDAILPLWHHENGSKIVLRSYKWQRNIVDLRLTRTWDTRLLFVDKKSSMWDWHKWSKHAGSVRKQLLRSPIRRTCAELRRSCVARRRKKRRVVLFPMVV